MKKTSLFVQVCLILSILHVAAAPHTALAATTIEKYQMSGDLVSTFQAWGDECSYNTMSISASKSAARNNNPPTQTAWISVTQMNYCEGIYTYGVSEPNLDWFTLDVQNLRTASLKGNIPMKWSTRDGDYDGNAAVDLQWIGSGIPQRTNNSSRTHSATFMSTTRTSGVAAGASLTGSISFDGNPVPLIGYNATIENITTGEMHIWRYKEESDPGQ